MFEAHAELLPEVVRKRCRHVITENARVLRAVDGLVQGDVEGFGRLMEASHQSLKLDYEVSRYELDVLVELAGTVKGVLGARLTGAGFGGCTVNLVEREAVGSFAQHMSDAYQKKTDLRLEIYVCGIEDGVRRACV
jgi:galactokinase